MKINNNRKATAMYFMGIFMVIAYLYAFVSFITPIYHIHKFNNESQVIQTQMNDISSQFSRYKKLYMTANNELVRDNAMMELERASNNAKEIEQKANKLKSKGHQDLADNIPKNFVGAEIRAMAFLGVPIIIALIFILIIKIPIHQALPSGLRQTKKSWWIYALSLFCFMVLMEIISRFTITPPSIFQQINVSVWNIYPYIRAIIIYPLIEELFFRGLLYRGLETILIKVFKKHTYLIVILVTSIAFTGLHLQYSASGMMMVFMTGIYLGFVRHKMKGVIPCVGAHSVLNIIAIIGSLI